MKRTYAFSTAILLLLIALVALIKQSLPVRICLVGDILLDRGVRKVLEERGYDYPYEEVKHIISRADIAFGNLECPLTSGGTPVFKRPELVFRGDRENARALKRCGFNVLNLANNHSMDQGGKGLVDTIDILKSSGINTLGAAPSRQQARQPLFIERGGIRVGFLGYSIFPPEGYISLPGRPDVCRVDYTTLEEEIRSASKRCHFLVVSFHWGSEYHSFPGDMQKELAHIAVDSGCDLVIGHHPHVLQGVERYKDALIFYSLGNFVFDRQIPMGTDETAILDVEVDRRGWKQAKVIPVKIVDCQPRIAGGTEGLSILNRLKQCSAGMGSHIKIQDCVGYITR